MSPKRESQSPDLGLAFLYWFREKVQSGGLLRALWESGSDLWQFLRESLPDRRKQRYGDVDFDWDYRVDTTSATVGWRERFLGLLHSPYQPSDPALFHEMMSKLQIDFPQFVFIDIGSGKGRALLMAADYPFQRVIGIELLPELHHIAQKNIAKYKSQSQKCFAIESLCADARDLIFPSEPLVLYLFNPLPKTGLVSLLSNLERSLREQPRPVLVLYQNALLEHVLTTCHWLRKFDGTNQYSIYVDAHCAAID